MVYRRGKSRACHQDLHSPLGMEAKREERLQQTFYYREENETGGLHLKRGGRVNTVYLFLCGRFGENACGNWQLR